MIIPPDPEKDPRLFDPSASTPSLLLEAQPPLDSDGDVGEYLPPYERREMSQREGHIGVTIPYRPDPPLPFNTNTETITPTSTIGESAFASTSRLPFHHIPTDTPASSTAKLWESSSSSSSVGISARRKGKARAFLGLPPKPKWAKSTSLDSSHTDATRFTTWYKRYKRWIWAILVFALIGVGLMIGLLAGLGTGQMKEQAPVVGSGPAWHDVEPGDQKWNLAWADGSMNLTWKDSRDAPPPTDGALSNCNTFLPLNTSDPTLNFSSLSTPYPSNKLWVSTYRIPLVGLNMSTIPYSVIRPPGGPNSTDPNPNPSPNSTRTSPSSTATSKSKPSSTPSSPPAIPDALGLLSPLPFFSRGIASSGSVEFIGKDAPVEVITGGEEGVVRVDVVVQYGGVQGVEGIMRVCEVSEGDVMGVGVYTPIQTDGKITNPYSLDPTQLPSFHIIVRFPPSLFNLTTISTYTNTSTSGINTTSDLNTSNTSLALSALSLTTPPPPGPLYLHSLSLTLDKMGVRLGDLDGIARFGTWNLTSTRGGAVVKSLIAKRVWVQTAENAVRGRFNVSESLYINSTDSSILADIVLHDPSSTTNTTLPRSSVASRGLPPPGYSNSTNTTLASSLANSTASTLTHNYTHTVNVTLHTSDGLIRLKYLAQPPQTALSSWVSLSSGEMDISVHPNYIGPFACKNAWGAVRLPPPSTRQWDDPLGQSRTRAVVQGVINIPDGSLFQKGGLNETLLPMSGTTVTGAAYWQSGNQTLTPQAVQDEEEGKRGNQMLLLGGWGDVTLRFDGS